jgi:hypothetical protein
MGGLRRVAGEPFSGAAGHNLLAGLSFRRIARVKKRLGGAKAILATSRQCSFNGPLFPGLAARGRLIVAGLFMTAAPPMRAHFCRRPRHAIARD